MLSVYIYYTGVTSSHFQTVHRRTKRKPSSSVQFEHEDDVIPSAINMNRYSLFTILLPKVVSFKHATQIPAREVLPVIAINMHVFLCYLETRKHFTQGDVFT